MKALLVRPSGALLPDVRIVADSAIGRDSMPLFIPDILGGWEADVCIAFRVNRLGKNIPAKFALRYIDAVSAVCVLRQPDAAFASSGAASIMDSLVTTGSWTQCGEGGFGADDSLVLDVNGTSTTVTVEQTALAQCIAEVSRVATVKSGDIFIMACTAVRVPLVPDTYVEAAVNGYRALHLKVK